MMKRRNVPAALFGAVSSGTLEAADAPRSSAVRRLGALWIGGAPPAAAEIEQMWAPARKLGWYYGKNITVERRYSSDPKTLQANADELVRLQVEVIVTAGAAAALAAKRSTTSIPILMANVGDPVQSGIVHSLAKPGGNITGFSLITSDLEGKRLQLLHEIVPRAQRIAVLVNSADSDSRTSREDRQQLYDSAGLRPILIDFAAINDYRQVIPRAEQQSAQALLFVSGDLGPTPPNVLLNAALARGLPTIMPFREGLEAGGLLSLSPDPREELAVFHQNLDKLLRGTKPSEIPIQQASMFVLAINLRAAKVLRVVVPRTVLLRADEVIE